MVTIERCRIALTVFLLHIIYREIFIIEALPIQKLYFDKILFLPIHLHFLDMLNYLRSKLIGHDTDKKIAWKTYKDIRF